MGKIAYRACTRCVMDTSDADITFNDQGVCNHCVNYESLQKRYVITGKEGMKELNHIIAEIRNEGYGKAYDCIVGISGGVDSSYTAYLAKQYGLKPLLVHVDNGWNSELAVDNIKNIVRKLGFDLETYVINWDEFKDVQLAYLKASVIDIEAISDHAIIAATANIAVKNKIKYILHGSNVVTEGVLPMSWIHNKLDAENIKSIHAKYGKYKLKNFPFLNVLTSAYHKDFLKIQKIPILNYVKYIKSEIKDIIISELGWRDYGGKHYESVFTRFYQGYILPVKFGVDKRRAHLSTLVCSGQISREEALLELQSPAYDQEQLAIDKEFVIKKLGLTENEFTRIMGLPIQAHTNFATANTIYDEFPILKLIRPMRRLLKGRKG